MDRRDIEDEMDEFEVLTEEKDDRARSKLEFATSSGARLLAYMLTRESWRRVRGDTGKAIARSNSDAGGKLYEGHECLGTMLALGERALDSGIRFIIAVACRIAVIRIASYL